MRLRCFNDVSDGKDFATIEITSYTNAEKVQGREFGTLVLSLGGNFVGTITGSAPGATPVSLDFSIEPSQAVIDPNGDEYSHTRYFSTTAETPDPTSAAAFYAQQMALRIAAAVAAWKAQTQEISFSVDETV